MRILFVTRHLNQSGFVILRRLIQERFNICGVLVKEEKSAWLSAWWRHVAGLMYRAECRYYRCRPLKATESEAFLARSAGLNVIAVKSIKTNQTLLRIKQAAPDIIVIGGGWHELIPSSVFQYPRLGCINTHPSLLPAFRGTSITRWQILEGAEVSGCTIHYVNEEFDAGSILKQRELLVRPGIAPQELFGELSFLAADMMTDLLRQFECEGKLRGEDISKAALEAKYYSKWRWSDAKLRIDWNRPFQDIERFVRANTQESYRYLGPWFRTTQGNFVLRSAVLRPSRNKTDSILPVLVEHSGDVAWLEKQNDPHALGIVLVQRKDQWMRWRRGCRAPKKIAILHYLS
jgi:methionyl-tRNA formyltransferase